MLTVDLQDCADLGAVAKLWRQFEVAAECSFFQSWDWVGCLAQERFPRPVLVTARRGGAPVALALFNRRGPWGLERLCLGESGHPAWDAVFIEHNGVLHLPGEAAAVQPCLQAALRAGSRLQLSGIGPAQLQQALALDAACLARQIRMAPFVDLAVVRGAALLQPEGDGYLGQLSANTRQQLRRSNRRYAEAGPLRITVAATQAQAHRFLDAMAVLHQATWTARGRPGAFANPAFVRFHHTLLDRSSGTELLQVGAGDTVVGYLYNFRHRGRVYAYQSGFDYAGAAAHAKPGLTCHHLAIDHYLTEGTAVYDFLAGDDRYKLSLATASAPLHWVSLARRASLPALAGAAKNQLRRVRP